MSSSSRRSSPGVPAPVSTVVPAGASAPADAATPAATAAGARPIPAWPHPPGRAIFARVADDVFLPSAWSTGPWDPAAQHGGPVAGLLHYCMLQAATEAEAASTDSKNPAPAPLQTMRLTVNLYRPVPTIVPCRVTTSLVYGSRSIRHYRAAIIPVRTAASDDTPPPQPSAVADCIFFRASAVEPGVTALLQEVETAGLEADTSTTKPSGLPVFRPPPLRPALPPTSTASAASPGGAGGVPPKLDRLSQQRRPGARILFNESLRANFAEDGTQSYRAILQAHEAGDDRFKPFYPSTFWFTNDEEVAFIEDRRHLPPEQQLDDSIVGHLVWPTLTDLAVMVGDFGSGISSVLDWAKFQFSNIDYTIIFHRPLVEENLDPSFPYLCMSSSSRISAQGAGVCRTEFFDARGRVAVGMQNLVVKSVPSKL
ncbi:hypothetical protein HK405_012179 [Cladochytrium tenue]|nr:hypothetical protein HK405_012179 [Cladochytrium tenue]